MFYDYIVIGGGIVGLSTALQLQQRNPDKRIAVLEKESDLAQHQSGRNSGVIHSGIYYPPGSFKARFCQAGAAATKAYCDRKHIPYGQPGKLIVATNEVERARLRALADLAGEHGIAAQWLDSQELSEREAEVRGLAALRLPGTGIVDYRRVARQMAEDFQALGGELKTACAVRELAEDRDVVSVGSSTGDFRCRYLIACAGLQADRLARMMGIPIDFRIVPVRGEYYRLPPHRQSLVSHMIYPVPEPGMPFLGVHLTPMMNGGISLGPNAVFAMRRESYQREWRQWRQALRDGRDSVVFAGFWRMGLKHWRFALAEARNSLSPRLYLKAVQKYCPNLTLEDLSPHPPGIRAQAVKKDGTLVHDFLFAESPRSLHVCNAPSPAATSAIPIGAYLCDKLASSGRTSAKKVWL